MEGAPQSIRLQKAIADRGLASRRKAEELIVAGKVKVNGQVVTELGTKVDPAKDVLVVDGLALATLKASQVVLLLNKPTGYATTRDKAEGSIVMQLISRHPQAAELNPVGRLDRDSRGLLLFTNDGLLHYALMDPARHLEKEYEVRVGPAVNAGQLKKMAQGLAIDGVMTKPCKVEPMGEDGFRITLTEGRNRQIRKMAAKVGLTVLDLKRVRQGPVVLAGLPEGRFRELAPSEVAALSAAIKRAGKASQ